MLTWRLTPHTIDATGGTVPFLIDWGHSRHPSANDLPQLDLAELSLLSPNPDRTVHYLDALGASAPVV